MARPTPSSAPASQRVRSRFSAEAKHFDDLYEDERLDVRLLRPGLRRRRRLALETIASYGRPRVLDVGCGSGRIAELALQAGTSRYVGIDFAEPMIELARERLARFGDRRCELILGDFLKTPIEGEFDVILALGLFDYLPEPERFAVRMAELCAAGGCVVGSFPAWSLLKGPVRKVRYEWIGDCPIYNYTRPQLERLFGEAGFGRLEVRAPGRSGFLLRAWRERAPERAASAGQQAPPAPRGPGGS
jgi:SAM-dependent methyltransferase